MDQRRVDRKIIDRWIDEHGPNGRLKLAVRASVSASTIDLARQGVSPKKFATRLRLCRALGVDEDYLFPPVAAGDNRAS